MCVCISYTYICIDIRYTYIHAYKYIHIKDDGWGVGDKGFEVLLGGTREGGQGKPPLPTPHVGSTPHTASVGYSPYAMKGSTGVSRS